MAKNKTFTIDSSLTFGSMRETKFPEGKSENSKNTASEFDDEGAKDITEKSAGSLEPGSENVSFLSDDQVSAQNCEEKTADESPENATSVREQLKKSGPMRRTSINISVQSSNYLSLVSKLSGQTQTEFLAEIILEDLENGEEITPDFNAIPEAKVRKTGVVKSISLPEDIYKRASIRAAYKMMAFSAYVDELLLKSMKDFSL